MYIYNNKYITMRSPSSPLSCSSTFDASICDASSPSQFKNSLSLPSVDGAASAAACERFCLKDQSKINKMSKGS